MQSSLGLASRQAQDRGPYSPMGCGLAEGLFPAPRSGLTCWKPGRREICLDPVNDSLVQQRRTFVPPGPDEGRLTGSTCVTAPGQPGPWAEFKAASRLLGTSDRLTQEELGGVREREPASLRSVVLAWGHLHSRPTRLVVRAGMWTRPVCAWPAPSQPPGLRGPVPVAFTVLLAAATPSSSHEQRLLGC